MHTLLKLNASLSAFGARALSRSLRLVLSVVSATGVEVGRARRELFERLSVALSRGNYRLLSSGRDCCDFSEPCSD